MIGSCTCGGVEFRVSKNFLIIHCCHCSWCQRETGSAFAINGLIETRHVSVLAGYTERVEIPSSSQQGQSLIQCQECRATLWSHYAAAKDAISFVRIGTLTQGASLKPDIHIFTTSKLPWIDIPSGANRVDAYYQRSAYWTEESVKRYKAALSCQTNS